MLTAPNEHESSMCYWAQLVSWPEHGDDNQPVEIDENGKSCDGGKLFIHFSDFYKFLAGAWNQAHSLRKLLRAACALSRVQLILFAELFN